MKPFRPPCARLPRKAADDLPARRREQPGKRRHLPTRLPQQPNRSGGSRQGRISSTHQKNSTAYVQLL